MGHISYLPMGRAGNALFQCAAGFSYAKKHGLKFSVPQNTSSEFWSPILLKHLIDYTYNFSTPTVRVVEQNFRFSELPFKEEWKNYNVQLEGYFQAPAYFDEYRDEMLEAFALPWELKDNVCSIHARYGDYLEIKGKHIVINEEYILKAMDIIKEKTGITRFKVFSDDLSLFQLRHGHLYNFEYSDNSDIMADLLEISCCHSNIGSSSTFSWWAQYLNKNSNKVVVTNKFWFQEGWRDSHGVVDTKDLIPDYLNWIKI